MSVWLTPELKPFYGGTYFPPQNRFGHPGFQSILGTFHEDQLPADATRSIEIDICPSPTTTPRPSTSPI